MALLALQQIYHSSLTVSLVIKHQHCYYYSSRSLHTIKQEMKNWGWMKMNYSDIRGFNEKITRGFQKRLLPPSLRLERTKSVCSWSAAMFHCREYGYPKEKSHILSKQKICHQSSYKISFTVPADQCKSSSQINSVGSIVSIPNYENLNHFIHFSWGGPQITVVEVFSSRIYFALLPQKNPKENLSVTECDRKWWQFKYLNCHPKMPSSELLTPTGSHKLLVEREKHNYTEICAFHWTVSASV